MCECSSHLNVNRYFLTLIEILLNTNFIDTRRKGDVNLIKLFHIWLQFSYLLSTVCQQNCFPCAWASCHHQWELMFALHHIGSDLKQI